MIRAATMPPAPSQHRLLSVDPRDGGIIEARVDDLPRLLEPGDLLVVNDSATVPASLRGRTRRGEVEVRLVAQLGGSTWHAVLFGAGDWRTDTRERPQPPRLTVGDVVRFPTTHAHIAALGESPRLVALRFDAGGDALWRALHADGAPVQYSYLADDFDLAEFQTVFASRPWSVEMPSAGRPLTAAVLVALRQRGIEIAALTHAAGLSSTGDSAIDARLPLPERYDIPRRTVEAIGRARRVIAVGTTVVRALEGCVATHGRLRPGPGETDLRIDRSFGPQVVDGVLSGVHEPGESHYELLQAFAGEPLLLESSHRAVRGGYRGHEFGDSCLIVPGVAMGNGEHPRASRDDRCASCTTSLRTRVV